MSVELGRVLRAFAWEVLPGRVEAPEGGQVERPARLGQGLDRVATRGKLDSAMAVSFAEARTNAVRADLLEVGFGTREKALAASQRIAGRLGGAMDGRSKPCLLVLSQHQVHGADERRVLVSTFPRDEVLRRTSSAVELWDDVFSLTSRYRKAALIDGSNTPTGFLTARVVDNETTGSDRSAAEFWVERFLQAAPQMRSKEGTRLLGQVLVRTLRSLQGDTAAFDQVMSAVSTLRSGPRRRRSMQTIAVDMLDGEACNAFLAAAGDKPETRAVFEVDTERLDEQLQYRIFDLPDGVKISAPFAVVGAAADATVRVEDRGGVRHVSAGGRVEAERVARRG